MSLPNLRMTDHCAPLTRAYGFVVMGLLGIATRGACQAPKVDLLRVREGREVVIRAKLDRCLDATVTFESTLTNMTSSVPLPVTVDSAGRSEFEIVRLAVKIPSQPSSYTFGGKFKVGGMVAKLPAPYAYSLPFRTASYPIVQGPRGGSTHRAGTENEEAFDWAMPIGTKVYPIRAGVVVALREDCTDNPRGVMGGEDYNFLVIRHEDGTYAEYQHLTRDGVLVNLGDKVTENDAVALSGNSGQSRFPHLHVMLYVNESSSKRKPLPIKFRSPSDTPVQVAPAP